MLDARLELRGVRAGRVGLAPKTRRLLALRAERIAHLSKLRFCATVFFAVRVKGAPRFTQRAV